MAKRGRRADASRLNAAAEQIGTALGHFAARIDALKRQRLDLANDLRSYISGARAMLESVRKNRRGRKAAFTTKAVQGARRGRTAGFKMSKEARRKMRLAWKRRRRDLKAAQKGLGKKATRAKKTLSKPLTEKI